MGKRRLAGGAAARNKLKIAAVVQPKIAVAPIQMKKATGWAVTASVTPGAAAKKRAQANEARLIRRRLFVSGRLGFAAANAKPTQLSKAESTPSSGALIRRAVSGAATASVSGAEGPQQPI
jgi:hypothetical protein